MSNSKKISQLNSTTTVLDNDLIPVVQSGETKKVSKANLLKEVKAVTDSAISTANTAKSDIDLHKTNKLNPHEVTKTQIGLGNVDNTADADKPISTATQGALDDKADESDLTAHTGNSSNPHGVTKAQVGLGNVDNTSDNNKPISSATSSALSNKADLTDGKVPANQLPSYVDDVIEVADHSALPPTGETGKIYVTLDTNIVYRWSGSAYVEISASLALGETSATAHRGDHGKTAYDHSQVTGNPHSTSKSDIGLGNVTNDSQVKRSEMGQANGVPTLGNDGKVPSSQLPPSAPFSRTPTSVTYASTITPVISGALSIQRIIATGDLTINIPTGGTDGANLELWITASGVDRAITLNAGIVVPTSSVFTSPQTISSGKKAKILLQYDATLNGGQWELTSYISAY